MYKKSLQGVEQRNYLQVTFDLQNAEVCFTFNHNMVKLKVYLTTR